MEQLTIDAYDWQEALTGHAHSGRSRMWTRKLIPPERLGHLRREGIHDKSDLILLHPIGSVRDLGLQ